MSSTRTAEDLPPSRAVAPRVPARAEMVGSLLRPPRLKEAVAAFYRDDHHTMLEEERGKDATHLHAIEDEAIREVVARQIATGIDVITDGEFRRWRFSNSFNDAVSGFALNTEPTSLFSYAADGTVVESKGNIVAERLRKIDSPAVREIEFMRSITDHPFKVTFPCPSFFRVPKMHYKPGVSDRVYPTRDEFLQDVVAVERELVADAVNAGAGYVQFDYPVYPHLVDEKWIGAVRDAGDDPRAVFDLALGDDRSVLEGIPAHVTKAMHICRGNTPPSRWFAEGSLDPLAERIFNELPYDKFLIEWDDPERDGGFEPLRFVPKDRIVVVGLITTKRPDLESADEVLRRIEEASQYLDIDQLAISPQCGFASGVRGNALDEDAQWRKLELVAQVADRVWPSR